MKIECSFAHLHGPLFFANKNWGEKLDIKNKTKGIIKISYDRETKELHLECEGKETFLPSTSVFSYVPLVVSQQAAPEPERQKPGPKPKLNAQVSGPHDHVFNQGPGKTRD